MARLTIDTGTLGNPATGDTLRTAMTKANTNFAELYTDLAATTSSNGNLTNADTNGDVKIFANCRISYNFLVKLLFSSD